MKVNLHSQIHKVTFKTKYRLSFFDLHMTRKFRHPGIIIYQADTASVLSIVQHLRRPTPYRGATACLQNARSSALCLDVYLPFPSVQSAKRERERESCSLCSTCLLTLGGRAVWAPRERAPCSYQGHKSTLSHGCLPPSSSVAC